MQEPLDKLVDESGGQQMRPIGEGPRSAMEKEALSWHISNAFGRDDWGGPIRRHHCCPPSPSAGNQCKSKRITLQGLPYRKGLNGLTLPSPWKRGTLCQT